MHIHPHLTRRHLVLGNLTSALLLATGCSRTGEPSGQPLARNATLLCLGDSLTFGLGAPAGASYPKVLEQLTGHRVQNAGISGDTTAGALARLPGLVQDQAPGLVLVSIGGNDFLRNLPLARTRDTLMQIVRTAAASTQTVLIAQPRPALLALATGSLEDHEVYAEIARETDVPLFAGGWSYVLSRTALRSDQIHANAEGYRVFAERLAQWLREKKYVT